MPDARQVTFPGSDISLRKKFRIIVAEEVLRFFLTVETRAAAE
jgi:hypothetical protein